MAKELSEAQLGMLLKMAGKKLGTDPETLRKTLESGKGEELLKKASANNDTLKKALSSQEMAEKLMRSPDAQELIKKLMKG
ncbi:MAG: hypothetical protein DBY25_01865 [Clostridiales bacterium]|nr:MAG: hypothetical protein DBY25_01865 [Clostridiales bacterium]